MKEIINLPGPSTKLIDSPIPSINDDQVLIKVVVSGSNPKDWKVAELANDPNSFLYSRYSHVRDGVNQGDDIAGVVEKVGKNVVEFKEGDRVAAFHEMLKPGGSYAEYAVAWAHTTFHLPESVSFEAVGSFAIKLLRASNIHPIIAIAGGGSPYVQSLLDLSKGDTVIDYRNGTDSTIAAIKSLNLNIKNALDTIVDETSAHVLTQVVTPGGQVDHVLPRDPKDLPGLLSTNTWVNAAHEKANGVDDCRDLCFVFCRWFSRALKDGRFKGHPFEVRENGLEGVKGAMKDLMDGKASAVKYVFRIAETPGL
ncbi:Ankyrin repeats (3 copies) family protein [Aspergillus niger]|uniref:Ankyrin repeats (3 copies) family protein n=1 Tax=Aspergillus niger TaxID=5061 RepID=A0A505I9W0_ASPNG|nr:Ankyrin repeats (3 copies) family protein [Aspergillus niger]